MQPDYLTRTPSLRHRAQAVIEAHADDESAL